ncbi:MAG: hypothetical protein EWV84_16435 [Microcystis sp. M_QC_C_20170808_M3Col]|nr:MAG: hypothetical protein EWV84_16435 [Microcystis sp. M_QC_C_20170808_M3Col]
MIRTSIITIIGTILVACGASLEEYQKFAKSGQEYATALDSLLVISGDYGSSLLFMLNQQTRCQDNILLTQKFRKFLKP